jgi:Bacterial PH domain
LQLPEIPEQMMATQLSSGERLLWSGTPRQGLYLRASDGYLVPFSLMWGGFAIYWEYTVLTSKAPFFFGIWGVPFVVIGLYMMFGRFFIDARQRSKTYYGLTNQRVLIVSGLFSRSVKSLQLRTLSDISLAERSDGTGTITFGAAPPWWSGMAGWPGYSRSQSPSFDSIANARDVADRIRVAQREA